MDKSPLVLIGCRYLMDFYIDTCEELGIELLGFVDRHFFNNVDAVDGVPCIGSDLDLIKNPKKYADAKFMIATSWDGNTRYDNIEQNGYHLRQTKLDLVNQANLPLHTLIDPLTKISKHNEIGPGTYIGRYVNIRTNNKIGQNVFIHDNTIIAHDTIIGDNCILGIGATIMGCVHIQDNVYVGTNATLVNGKSTKQPYITIGSNCKIHAGALVQKDMPANTTATFNGRYLTRTDIG